MNVTDINTVLAVVVALGAAAGLLIYLSPTALDWVAGLLHARACALSAARAAYREAYLSARHSWLGWLGSDAD